MAAASTDHERSIFLIKVFILFVRCLPNVAYTYNINRTLMEDVGQGWKLMSGLNTKNWRSADISAALS